MLTLNCGGSCKYHQQIYDKNEFHIIYYVRKFNSNRLFINREPRSMYIRRIQNNLQSRITFHD